MYLLYEFSLSFSVILLTMAVFECKRVKRVIGGHEVACGSQIQVASLRNLENKHLCGVTLFSPYVAVTAAHCVDQEPDKYQLQLNNYCIEPDQEFPQSRIYKVTKHPDYNKYSRAHDIAVLRVHFDLNDITWLNDMLPKSSFGISGDCVVYGYGYTHVGVENISEKLLVANLHLISLDACTQKLGPYVAPHYSSGMLCALGDGADTCQGDSGGPLFCEGKLQGICSYGLSCGVKGLPGVYTSIGPNLQWLRSELSQCQ